MKMRFSLATLLHLRKLREEQQRGKLAAANLRKLTTQQEADRLEALLKDASRVSVDGEEGTRGARMNFVRECCAVLGIHEKRAKQRAEAANAEAIKQEKSYLAARREFEVLESYRERQIEVFHTMELRQNQKDLDEVHLLTRAQRSGQALPSGAADLAQTTLTSDDLVQQENIGRRK